MTTVSRSQWLGALFLILASPSRAQCVDVSFLRAVEADSSRFIEVTDWLAPEHVRCRWTNDGLQFCPGTGAYVVWQNNDASYWFPVREAETELFLGIAKRLPERLKSAVPAGDYANARVVSVRMSGEVCVPLGLAGIGSLERVAGMRAERAALDNERKQWAEDVAKARALRGEGRSVEASAAEAGLQRRVGEMAAGLSGASAQRGTAPGVEPGEGAAKPTGEVTGNGDTSPGHSSDGTQTESNGGPKEGSPSGSESSMKGGALPGSAPAWAQRLADGILRYFGVDSLAKSGALALLMLEPELFQQFADLAGGLVNGIVPADMSRFMDEATSLYDSFAAIAAFYDTVTSPESGLGDILKESQALLDALPPEVAEALQKDMFKQLANTLDPALTVLESDELASLGAILAGDFSKEAQAALRSEVEEKVREEARRALTRVIQDEAERLGVTLPADFDPGRAIASGDYRSLGEAVARGAMQRAGIKAEEVDTLLAGKIDVLLEDRLRAAAAEHLEQAGIPINGLRDGVPAALASIGQASARHLVGRAPPDVQPALQALLAGDAPRGVREATQAALVDAGMPAAAAAAAVQGDLATLDAGSRQLLMSKLGEWSGRRDLSEVDLIDPDRREQLLAAAAREALLEVVATGGDPRVVTWLSSPSGDALLRGQFDQAVAGVPSALGMPPEVAEALAGRNDRLLARAQTDLRQALTGLGLSDAAAAAVLTGDPAALEAVVKEEAAARLGAVGLSPAEVNAVLAADPEALRRRVVAEIRQRFAKEGEVFVALAEGNFQPIVDLANEQLLGRLREEGFTGEAANQLLAGDATVLVVRERKALHRALVARGIPDAVATAVVDGKPAAAGAAADELRRVLTDWAFTTEDIEQIVGGGPVSPESGPIAQRIESVALSFLARVGGLEHADGLKLLRGERRGLLLTASGAAPRDGSAAAVQHALARVGFDRSATARLLAGDATPLNDRIKRETRELALAAGLNAAQTEAIVSGDPDALLTAARCTLRLRLVSAGVSPSEADLLVHGRADEALARAGDRLVLDGLSAIGLVALPAACATPSLVGSPACREHLRGELEASLRKLRTPDGTRALLAEEEVRAALEGKPELLAIPARWRALGELQSVGVDPETARKALEVGTDVALLEAVEKEASDRQRLAAIDRQGQSVFRLREAEIRARCTFMGFSPEECLR